MIGSFILSLCMYVLVAIIFSQTSSYPDFGNFSIVGPEVIPNFLGWIILAIAVYIMLKEIVKILVSIKRRDETPYYKAEWIKTRDSLKSLSSNKHGVIYSVGSIILMGLYAFSMKYIGFEIATLIFILAVMLLGGERNVWKLIIVPIAAVFVVYGLFVIALKVRLPFLFLN